MKLKDKTIPNFFVDVRCFTFNQSKYITDTMNGFCMQQTNFPFICCIVDDASTDGEQKVIDEYLKKNFDFSDGSEAYKKETDYAYITFAKHKTNSNCYFAVLYLKENHYSRNLDKRRYLEEWTNSCGYEAPCEGDDFWTDPLKLQKQFDFLTKHPEYSLVYTKFTRVTESGEVINQDAEYENQLSKSKSGWIFYDLAKGNFIQTLTIMYRKDCYQGITEYYDRIYDFPCYLHAAGKNPIYFMSDNTGCYRITLTGAMHTGALSFDANGKHTLSCAFIAFLNGEYSSVPFNQKMLFFLRSMFRLFFRDIDYKKEIWKTLFYSMLRCKKL